MNKNQEKTGKNQPQKKQSKVLVKIMMEAKVPSASYELSEKPACHSGVKYESG